MQSVMPPDLSNYTIWVLAPQVMTNDSNLDYYYDYSQSIAEYQKVFENLKAKWFWQPVTLQDYRSIIDGIVEKNERKDQLVLNLCDGDEVNDAAGISVIHYLTEKGICYTGADAFFYSITTSKIPMKQAFDQEQVPTAPWRMILNEEEDLSQIFDALGTPIIVKPAVSGGSMGIGIQNVVYNVKDCNEQVRKMFQGYRGWSLTADGIVAESFIEGPEYTVFITGNHVDRQSAKIYTPVERVFHASLPENEKFLSFDRLWEIYEEETPMPNEDFFYQYALPEASLIEPIKSIAWDAFAACKGTGYARVDLRMDQQTKKLYVLEVNAQCGISEDEDFTSIGAILRVSNESFTELIASIISASLIRTNATSV